MFEDCTIKYGTDLGGVRNGIIITYPENASGGQDVIACPIDTPNNRYYKMVMAWVDAGNTIAEAD
tara:strand:+ start:620 stop:814 length:195 start_codon:yes stop_codon:yes gene_type:complete